MPTGRGRERTKAMEEVHEGVSSPMDFIGTKLGKGVRTEGGDGQ